MLFNIEVQRSNLIICQAGLHRKKRNIYYYLYYILYILYVIIYIYIKILLLFILKKASKLYDIEMTTYNSHPALTSSSSLAS